MRQVWILGVLVLSLNYNIRPFLCNEAVLEATYTIFLSIIFPNYRKELGHELFLYPSGQEHVK